MRLRLHPLGGALLGVLGVALVLLLPWQLAVAFGARPVILPAISAVAERFVALTQAHVLGPATLVSLARVNAGFALAAATAVPLGLLLGRDDRLLAATETLIESFRFVVPFAWIPIAILWFGTSEAGKLFIIWYAAFFIILLQTIAGVRGVDADLVKAARSLGASGAAIFRKVVVPAALPAIITGFKIGFATSWISLLAAEMVASRAGLGYLVMDAREFLETDTVIAGMAVIGAIGALYSGLFTLVQRRLLRHRAEFTRL
jgi:ABC-type nitrate/sulfonate/bicarbonate transport system permease component